MNSTLCEASSLTAKSHRPRGFVASLRQGGLQPLAPLKRLSPYLPNISEKENLKLGVFLYGRNISLRYDEGALSRII